MTEKVVEVLRTAVWITVFLAVLAYMQQKDAQESALREDNITLIKALADIVTKCTNRGDNYIIVDNEYHVCGATPTGIRAEDI